MQPQGELESTLVHAYLRGSALRRWLAAEDNHEAVKYVSNLLTDAFPPNKGLHREISLSDLSKDMEVDVEDPIDSREISQLLLSRLHDSRRRRDSETRLYKRVRINGVIYSCDSTHLGNSLIQYRPIKSSRGTLVGQINHIISDSGTVFLAIQSHKPLPKTQVDPFSRYLDFPAQLVSFELNERLDIIETEQIVAHVARFHVPESSGNPLRSVVVSLNRY